MDELLTFLKTIPCREGDKMLTVPTTIPWRMSLMRTYIIVDETHNIPIEYREGDKMLTVPTTIPWKTVLSRINTNNVVEPKEMLPGYKDVYDDLDNDRFFYGFRDVYLDRQGNDVWEQIPLTLDDSIHPQLGDHRF